MTMMPAIFDCAPARGNVLDVFRSLRLRSRSHAVASALARRWRGDTMTRSIVAVWSAGLALTVVSATMGCQATHVGDPCTPEQEYDPSFLGYSQTEVSVESKSFQCETRLCLVDHFQGRVSCPYGQSIYGGAPAPLPVTGCVTPATGVPVTGRDSNGNIVDTTQQA